jgi:uncharacterized protein YndB with AHSA1/START domain
MTNQTARASRSPVVFERTYEADVEDLWALWTTKQGFESWWGPEGFRVEVHAIDPRVGGLLHYDMIADTPEHIEYMKQAGMGVSHETRGTFTVVEPQTRLELVHVIDFLPGVEPYDNRMTLELSVEGANVRMVISVEPHYDAEMTKQATMGMESQLTKVPAALAARVSG